MNAHLLVTAGADKGKTFPLTDEFNVLLGRSKDANSRLNDAAVSRVHCEIEVKGTQILLTDRDSSSGTFVNSKRVAECELKPGDQIRIGDTKLRVEAGQAADADRTIAPRGRSAPASPPVSAAVPRRPAVVTSERLPQLKGAKLSHYELGDVIAKGHTGLIFKANDFKYDRPVAFKVLFPEIAQDEEEMKRFTRAMKTMIGLTHPNLVTLYGAGKTSGYCWLAMEYVEGESIRQVLNRTGTANQLDWRITLRIGIGVARALEFAHSKNIIHRNITPQNVLWARRPTSSSSAISCSPRPSKARWPRISLAPARSSATSATCPPKAPPARTRWTVGPTSTASALSSTPSSPAGLPSRPSRH